MPPGKGVSASSPTMGIHWFRNGLRLHDNPSLGEACRGCAHLLPLVVLDPAAPMAQSSRLRPGAVRANFVLESLNNLNGKLLERGGGGRDGTYGGLVTVLGKPHVVIPQIVNCLREHGSDRNNPIPIYYEQDVAAPVRKSDSKVWRALASEPAVAIHKFDSHTLHPMESYAALCPSGAAPPTYTGFGKIFRKLGPVPDEAEAVTPAAIPPPVPRQVLDKIREALQGDDGNEKCVVHVGTVPTLLDLGYSHEQVEQLRNHVRQSPEDHLAGGEDAALLLLEKMMKRTAWVAQFEKPKTSPNALTFDTTGLSPYVKHGCLSPRRFYHELSRVYALYSGSCTAANPPKLSQPPVSLHGQLMWREYNYLMGYLTPNFDRMEGNPVARQIPWDDDPRLLEAWKNSQTGYPFIDAIMTQLRQTGWIHHLARHAVACFLTRGDLWQSWEKGAAVFEEYLVDADWSINNFNWQWLSCTAHFYQYFRCYSPVAFGKKTDPNGDYIRKWLPQFRRYPTKYIYEPWTAPLEVQRRCGVVIGVDYPHPIVEHAVISKSNMQRMKHAYDAHNSANANAGA